MINIQKTDKTIMLIDMTEYGLNTMISTDFNYLEFIINSLKKIDMSEKYFGDKTCNEKYYSMLNFLKEEDEYFEDDIEKYEKRQWEKYVDDCVWYVALAYVLEDKPIHLVYPKANFKKLKFKDPLEKIKIPYPIWES